MSERRFTRRSRWTAAPAAVLAVCLLSAALVAAPADPPVATTQPASEAGRYQRLVNDLTSDAMGGRGPGTRGIELARDYVVEHFKQAGLPPALGKAYVQPLKMRLGVKVAEQALEMLDADGKVAAEAKAGADFSALGFSASRRFEGPAVFVGYGIVDPRRGYDSYAGLKAGALRGKVAVAFRYEPQDEGGHSRWMEGSAGGQWSASAALLSKAKWSGDHGAAALLVVNPPSQDADKSLRSAGGTAFGGRGKIPVMHISTGLLRRMLSRAGHEEAGAAARRLQARADAGAGGVEPLAGVTLRGQVRLASREGTIHNVVAVLRGAGKLADQFIVVGAHYDHLGQRPGKGPSGKPIIYRGADDNASGTAGLMTLARWLGRRGAGAPAVSSDCRSILFAAFSGEERGLVGSRYLIEHPQELGIRREQIVAMVNMDMIGRLRRNRIYVRGVDSGDRWGEIVRAAAEGCKLDVRTGGGGYGPSDHASFYRRKIPVLFFITGGHSDIHRPSDTPEKINAAGAVEVLHLVRAVLERLRVDPAGVAYVAPKAPTTRPAARRGHGAYLGVMPDPVALDGEDGCPLMEVLEAGPAGQAGLKDDDVIVAWNGQPVRNVQGLLTIIAGHKPGDAVKLTVQRDGERIDIQVTLGQR